MSEKFHDPENILLVAAGHVDHEELVGHLRPLFETLRRPAGEEPPRIRPERRRRSLLPLQGPGAGAHLPRGKRPPICRASCGSPSAVLNTILGGNMSSRLFQEIREKRGLAYSVFSFLTAFIDSGLLGVYMATDPSDVNRSLEVIGKEIRGIRKGDISSSELEETKEHLIGGILLGAESTDARMMRLAKNEYVFGRYVDCEEVISRIERVKMDEVVAVAEEAFRDGEVSLVTLGPLEEKALDRGCLRFS